MLVQQHGDFQLGSDAVGAGDQYRMFNPGQVERHHSAESADLVDTCGGLGSGNMFFHQFNCTVAGGYVYACFLIAFAVTFHAVFTFLSAQRLRTKSCLW